MGKIILFLILVFFVISCESLDYKYQIVGKVAFGNKLKEAHWYTDTIFFDGDTAVYENSDGSVVRINPPYKINKLK